MKDPKRKAVNPFDAMIESMKEDDENQEDLQGTIAKYVVLKNAWETIYNVMESQTTPLPSARTGFAEARPLPTQPHLIRSSDVDAIFYDLKKNFNDAGGHDLEQFHKVVTYMIGGWSSSPVKKTVEFDMQPWPMAGGTIYNVGSFSQDQAKAWDNRFIKNNMLIAVRGNFDDSFEEWKRQLYGHPDLPPQYRPFIRDISPTAANELWKFSMAEGITEDNAYFSDFGATTLTPMFFERGGLVTTEELSNADAFRLEVAEHPDIDLTQMTPQEQVILKKWLTGMSDAIKNKKAEVDADPKKYGPWTDAMAKEVAINYARAAAQAILNPDQELLDMEEVQAIFNSEGIDRFGTTLGDLRRPPSSDEQYLLRLAFSQSLEHIQAKQAVGEKFKFMDLITGNLDALPDPDEIERRQELRFGQMPPGTVVVGVKPEAPRPEAPRPEVPRPVVDPQEADLGISARAQTLMQQQFEGGSPLSWQEAVDLARKEVSPKAAPGAPDEESRITAGSESLRRYDALNRIRALPKGPERQAALRQFIIDEDLSPNLLKGKLRVDTDGNPVIDPVTGEQVYDPAPINEADLILESFQPMPFSRIIEQRERQVGKSIEDVQARLKPFTEATTQLAELAKTKGINLETYTGGDAEIDAAQAALDEVTEAGRVAQKQMEQRDREQKIREEGPPVDVAELPSSEQPMDVGLAAAQKGLIDAQERERKRQQDLAAIEAARQTGSAPRTLGGGLAV